MRKRGTRGVVAQIMRKPGIAGKPGMMAVLLAASLCLLLAACASGGTGQGTPTQPATGNPTIALPSATDQAALTPPSIPSYPAGGTPGTLGTGDVCDPHEQLVSATLPSNIPTYPGAQMHLGSVNGADGEFGLCTSDSIATVSSFYSSQLPAHQWQQVNSAGGGSFVQITATSGSTSLTVTIDPSAAVSGYTQILIIYAGK